MSTPELKPYPILLLGGAKRVSIARHLEAAFRARGYKALFFSYEIEKRVPIAVLAEVISGKRWSDPELYTHLREIVENKGIRMIVPFVDGAVGVAAQMCERYPELGLFVPGSDSRLSEIMFDKRAAAELFERCGLPVPRTDRGNEPPRFPLIAKPRHGSASKGIAVLENEEEYRALCHPEAYLIQEYIADREEISIDCYVGVHSGKILTVSPRRRLETLGGEAVRSVTLDDTAAEDLARRTLEATGLRGAVTIQLIRDLSKPDRLLIMEINPRLGGGVVCSIGAGADIAGNIADEAIGMDAQESRAKPGTEMYRYFQEVIFKA
ncbi:MAG: ATP-grasp domain-containing protein [Muribaculaceae bacterium]|nr:ATP-grasp domain-containing protein [Muribaculaceae bacterium]